jgi:hypothetical protein
MIESVGFPVSCYIALAIAAVAVVYSFSLRNASIGLPMLTVVGTAAAWYFGDAFYNDYHEYVLNLGAETLDAAWWQVALFLVAFCIFAPFMHRWMNKKLLGEDSHFLMLFYRGGLDRMDFQERVTAANGILTGAWLGLMFIALMRTNFDFLGMFAPFVAGKAQPWMRGRIGGGLSAFISFFNYLHIMLAAAFGIIWAVSKNPRTRTLAMVVSLLTIPWFLLDRTRNTMLAVALPGLLAWVFVRLKGGIFLKVAILAVAFLVTEGWMRFVIEARSGADISRLVQQIGLGGVVETVEQSEVKHAGLNMLEELAWINNFLDKGTYAVNRGKRYWAELVNPIPRGLWQDKPLIELDYAIARGQRMTEGLGVTATISTGMIGQGVVNFGPFFGVLAAAFLMALWVAILARQDLKGEKTGRMAPLLHRLRAHLQPRPRHHPHHAVSVFVWICDVDSVGAGQRGALAQAPLC